MVSYTQFGFRWIVFVIFLSVFERCNCSGVVQVTLTSLTCSEDVGVNRSCCTGANNGNNSVAKPCSREIFMCLVEQGNTNAACLSENRTYIINNFCNHVRLNRTTYLRFGFRWPGISLRVVVYLGSKTECSPGRPIMVYNSSVALYSNFKTPNLFGARHNFKKGDMNLTHSNISYEYSVHCDENFYGQCDKYCRPGNTTTNCTKDGTNICISGWTGSNCTIESCTARECENNGSCVNETCHCGRNYTGKYCESLVPDLSSKTSSSKYLITSTLSEGEQKGQHADPDNNTAMYAGMGVGIVLAIALAAVIAYVILRKKHRVGHKNFKKSDEVEKDGTDSCEVKRQTDSGK